MIELRSADTCKFDEISLGEIMLRLDPGSGRIKTANSFEVWEGGGEYNVAKALSSCFGLKTAVATAFADNEIGHLLGGLVRRGGVDSSLIQWKPFDGLGRKTRNGLNFTERGFGIRAACGVSDRGNTAASQLCPGDFDFEYIFGTLGTRWFHTGGIFAALSENCAQTLLDAVKTARKHGAVVSYDINFRPSLWSDAGGEQAARELNGEIAKYTDVLIGNVGHFASCLSGVTQTERREMSFDERRELLLSVLDAFPNLKLAAMTERKTVSASLNDWSAMCCSRVECCASREYRSLEIFDRVGGGDGFASGLVYGLMEKNDLQYAVDCGAAHGALAMTTPGDTSMASFSQVESLMYGASGDIRR